MSEESYKVETGDEVEITGDFLEDSVLKGRISKIVSRCQGHYFRPWE